MSQRTAQKARRLDLSDAGIPEDTSLAGDVARRLEEDILRGAIRPGQRLDERELSERYGVSRTPVREALQRLSASGLASARGRQGLQVSQFSVADLLDALSVVASMEALAASQAARRITQEQRAVLEAEHAACGAAIAAGDYDAFYDANIRFHDAIAAASHNRVLQDELRRLSVKTAPYRRRSPSSPVACRNRSPSTPQCLRRSCATTRPPRASEWRTTSRSCRRVSPTSCTSSGRQTMPACSRMRPDKHLDCLPTGPSVRSSRAR